MLEVVVLGSGSGGNATIVRNEESAVLIDAGFSAAELTRRLETAGIPAESITGLLVTHEHEDHVRGIRVFCRRNPNITVYANLLTAQRLHHEGKTADVPMVFTNGSPFQVGPFVIDPFSISHDAVDPVAFVISHRHRRIAIATDFGFAGRLCVHKLRDCDALVLESNHDPELLRNSGRPPRLIHRIRGRLGHLNNQAAADLLAEIVGPATRHLTMAHLSGQCNRPAIVHEQVRGTLRGLNRADIAFAIAAQDAVSPPMLIDP